MNWGFIPFGLLFVEVKNYFLYSCVFDTREYFDFHIGINSSIMKIFLKHSIQIGSYHILNRLHSNSEKNDG